MRPPGPVTLGIGGLLGHDGNAALFAGGRLIASSQEAAPGVLDLAASRGFEYARVVGEFTAGPARVFVL